MLSAGMVYDWCFQWLDDHGPLLIEHSYRLARMLEVGYPPTGQGAITGHAGEAMLLRDLIGTGLAIYDESPECFLTSERIFREFVPARNFFILRTCIIRGRRTGPIDTDGRCRQRTSCSALGFTNPFIADQGELPFRWIYTERPDGKLMPEGAVFRGNSVAVAYMHAAGLYRDPYVQDRFLALTLSSRTLSIYSCSGIRTR